MELNFDECNIELACEVYLNRYNRDYFQRSTLDEICFDVENWGDAREYLTSLVYDTFGDRGEQTFKKLIEGFLTPVKDKKFFECHRNDFNQTPSYINFGYAPNYVYIAEEVEGKYGKQFKVAPNCESELFLTYSRKQLNESFEVGKFYRVELEDVKQWGNGYKKYCYSIEEIDEKTYIEEGIMVRNHIRG